MIESARLGKLGWSGGVVALAFWVTTGNSSAAQRWPSARLQPYTYTYAGIAYDRRSVNRHSRAWRNTSKRLTAPPAASPYVITDLQGSAGGSQGLALGINDAGDIAYVACGVDGCDLADITDDSAYVLHDNGTSTLLFRGQYADPNSYGAVPYAINDTGDEAGQWYSDYSPTDGHAAHADWTPKTFYDDPTDAGSFALALNDANTSVGQAIFAGVPSAALFRITPAGGNARPKALAPPKGTSWVGTATGINASGTIVGYEVFGNGNGRAVRLFLNKSATVLPVGAAGASTSAQAINVHGDVVGNAGSQAYLYKNDRVLYLPRPPGESAGNAVAYAINASDDVVGDIIVPTSGGGYHSTSFLYKDGRSYDLDTLVPGSGWQLYNASGINDSGEIIGTGELGGNDEQAFSMKPS